MQRQLELQAPWVLVGDEQIGCRPQAIGDGVAVHPEPRGGAHHGIEGFREFSNARGVVVRGDEDNTDVLFPPYGEKARAVASTAFGA